MPVSKYVLNVLTLHRDRYSTEGTAIEIMWTIWFTPTENVFHDTLRASLAQKEFEKKINFLWKVLRFLLFLSFCQV